MPESPLSASPYEVLGVMPRAFTSAATDVYVVHQGGATAARAFLTAERLRDAGLDVICHAGEASIKSQMKRADASGAEPATGEEGA